MGFVAFMGTLLGIWISFMLVVVNGWLPVIRGSKNRTVQVVVDLLDKSDEWVVDRHHAKHPVGVSIWIANGRPYCRFEVDGQEAKINAFDRNRIWNAFKRVGHGSTDKTALLLANRIIERYGDEKVVPIGRLRA